MTKQLPIAIIGAGPIGLAAAAQLVQRGETPLVLEAGSTVGASVRAWGHVQLFSPWRYCIDAVAGMMLEETGWIAPPAEEFPTGNDLVERYLIPLASHPLIAPHIRLNQRVVAIARTGLDKMKTPGREHASFQIEIVDPAGNEQLVEARAVIDASGTYASPNPLGANGLLATGERTLAGQIAYGIPDVRGTARTRYAGKRVLVAGSGHSAFNTIMDLVALSNEVPSTQIIWVVRRSDMAQAYGGGDSDALPERGALGQRIRKLVEAGTIQLVSGWRTDRLEHTTNGIVVWAGNQSLTPVDEIIVATGLRPDLAMLRELRLELDSAIEAPSALAPLIDPNVHSCGTVLPHGVDQLTHPEPGFYIIGMKSYGRAPTFLLLTGYEQARSVTAALTGDWEAARRVELVLPETGVCSGPIAAGGLDNACCGSSTPTTTLSPTTIDLVPLTTFRQAAIGSLLAIGELTAVASAAAACCAPAAQATCCAPEDKADCCGETVGATCACS